MTKLVRYPFGDADVQALAFAAVMAASIDNTETHINMGQMTAAGTLNLTVNSEMRVGSRLTVQVSVDGTNRNLTHGAGMTGAVTTLTANKSYALSYKFNGATFVHVGTQILN